MPSACEQLQTAVLAARTSYHRLVLLVGPSGSGKTAILRDLSGPSVPLLNANRLLARRLLEYSPRDWPLRVAMCLESILEETGSDTVLLDNTEMLLDRSALAIDPLRLLQGAARNRTVVASWNGSLQDGHLLYGGEGHPGFLRYPARDLMAVSTEALSN